MIDFQILIDNQNVVMKRVHHQLSNISHVNSNEAFDIALAHVRMLNMWLAQMAGSDEEYVDNVNELNRILIMEGLKARAHAKQAPCHDRS